MCLFVCVCVCACAGVPCQEHRVVLQSSAVSYVSLNSPVRGTERLRATASPALLQLTSDIQRVSTHSSSTIETNTTIRTHL